MSKEESYFIEVGQTIPQSIQSQMFGAPCFKMGKKAFTCYYNLSMVFKLTGEAHSEAISLDGTELFDPSGKNRAMKEWVQVPFDYKDKWASFAQSAAKYVGEK